MKKTLLAVALLGLTGLASANPVAVLFGLAFGQALEVTKDVPLNECYVTEAVLTDDGKVAYLRERSCLDSK